MGAILRLRVLRMTVLLFHFCGDACFRRVPRSALCALLRMTILFSTSVGMLALRRVPRSALCALVGMTILFSTSAGMLAFVGSFGVRFAHSSG